MYYVILKIPLAQYDVFFERTHPSPRAYELLINGCFDEDISNASLNARCRFSATKTKHNAPPISGDPAASIEDQDITRRLKETRDVLGIVTVIRGD